ncbi:PREDICTED: alkane hydroxylase MAH1-like [Ipomoea nil]|uniref:alkane hydroxylase MAH1-like n=1 Tax=Ipomoea nil TaxID=35883 RepID=UPI00090089C5|nr:PREDICTED: alkane hydroxylase MAH1-like [Ipomoea nil]XP_019183017.1 PREDICTED: alkane hydroxylase MAH1-like [Ipomoea nil]XP_019183018.1 PREDICTED: alkane hydroxylase MAH1-like [Ipomoea nil]
MKLEKTSRTTSIITCAMASIDYFEIFVAFFCLVIWIILRDGYRRPLKVPLFGMLPSLFLHVRKIHDRCAAVLSLHGGTFLLKGPWFTNLDILITVDPANVHYIMSGNFENFPKGKEFKKIFDVLGDGIFNSDLDLWKNQRKLARALIIHQRFHRYLVRTSWNKVEKGLIPVLEFAAGERGGVVDLQDVFQRFTFDTTCTLVTGYDPGCLSVDFPDVPFSKAMDDAEEVLFIRHLLPESLWKLQQWLGIGPEKKLSRACEILDQVIGKYITMKRQELILTYKNQNPDNDINDENGFDLLTSYINNNDGETTMGLKFDDKFLRDTILNLMIAGRDTTSSALTWFIWLVSTHPEVEKNIRDELLTAVNSGEDPKKFRLFKAEELKNLVYLHAALCESLRLYPPVPFQHKSPLQTDILPSGHKVSPDTRLMFSLYAMGRMQFIWGKDAKEFKPERWINWERGAVKHEPSYKFLAFNAGPRTCLGKEVAFTQMKAVAAAIIHNYHVRAVKNHDASPNVSIILYMKHGLKVRVQRRWT